MATRSEAELARDASETASAAIESAREATAEYLKGEIELSSGIVLALRDVPPLALRQASLLVPIPEVPIVHIESRDRDEENPNDPDYVDAVAERDAVVYRAGVDVALVMGTSCKSVPDGWCCPEDGEWIEELTIGDIAVDTSTGSICTHSATPTTFVGRRTTPSSGRDSWRRRSRLRSPRFSVLRHGQPIQTMQLKEQVTTGIQYDPPMPGMISEIEERQAARFNGHDWVGWRALGREERIDSVAIMRLDQMVESHANDAVNEEARRRMAAARAKR